MPDDETTPEDDLAALAAEAEPAPEAEPEAPEVVEPEAIDLALEPTPELVLEDDVEVAEAASAESQLSSTDFEPYMDEAGGWVTPELVAYENQAWLAQVGAYERATGTALFPPAVAPAEPAPATIDEAYPTPPAEDAPVAPEGA